MKDKDRVCLEKIGGYCHEIISFRADISYEDFLESNMLKFSCSFALGQIGELVKQMSDEIKEIHNEVAWHKIAGFRNRIIHEYDKLNLSFVWEAITENIPELLTYTQKILNNINQEENT